MTHKFVEHGALLEHKSKNVVPIRIITEGRGTTAHYSRELLEANKDRFANLPMFMNHPHDPNRPWERDVTTIAAKTGPKVEYKVVDGVAGLYTEAHVGSKWQGFVEEFGDVLDVSVYVAGTGQEDEDGIVVAESFVDDPYNSIDFVVAGGRGGKVLRAMESYRAIENSGPDGSEPGSEASGSANTKKARKMDEEQFKTLMESLAPVIQFVANQQKKAEEESEVQKTMVSVEQAVANYAAAEKAISEADLFDSQKQALREEARKGADITPLLESAKKVHDEAIEATRLSEGFITQGSGQAHDYRIAGL